MREISNTYNPYTDLRKLGVNISFGVIDTTAKDDATPAGAGSEVSKPSQITDDISAMGGKYASLEPNLFILDGTMEYYDDGQVGYNSSVLSGADGTFASNPYVDITFSQTHSSFGFVLRFDDKVENDYPTEFEIVAFRSGTEISRKTFTADSPQVAIGFAVSNYDELKIIFKKTSIPYRRVRLCEVVFGLVYNYNKNSIGSLELDLQINPMSEMQPTGELLVTIDNSNHLYNMLNPTGIFSFLQEGQKASLNFEINDEIVEMGEFEFSTASTTNAGLTATLTFHDLFYRLDNFKRGLGNGSASTLQALVESLNLGVGVVYNGLGSTTIINGNPEGATYRECLKQWSMASKAYCFINTEGKLEFKEASVAETEEEEWTLDRQTKDAEIKVSQFYDGVILEVGENTYTSPNTTLSRPYQFTNPCVYNGQAVAEWLWTWVKKRNKYEASTRGNPALDIGDTVQINDIFGVNANAMLTRLHYIFDGGLECRAEAVR